MLYSKLFIPTLKEIPSDAVIASHILMLRAGMIRRLAGGIYTYLPLGLRVIAKIESVIREQMRRAGAVEILMPVVQPGDLWVESGRWSYYGPELLRFKDRKGSDFCLGPTHEEVVTELVRKELRTYRELPLILFQIQTKFRDEIRPRFGLIRSREFIMKDAYSFDLDREQAMRSYWKMYETYTRIFTRLGLRFKAVEASTGAIGGSFSHEFQVLAESGEDTILSCSRCDYAANIERALSRWDGNAPEPRVHKNPPLQDVITPQMRTIAEVCGFLGIPPDRLCKTLVYLCDGRPVVVLVRGDHELAESKLASLLGCDEIVLADERVVQELTGAPVGFAGPVGLSEDVPIYADYSLKSLTGGVTGANREDHHTVNVDAERDFPKQTQYHDLRIASEGEVCPRCGKGVYQQHRGIEVGQVFYLGSKYSERMNATVLDESGKPTNLLMGCYGIGIGRTMAAAIEQNHDEDGILWPSSLAPFHAVICPVGKDSDVLQTAERLYLQLRDRGIEVVLDDRRQRPGVMFKDADLIGFPFRITLGRRSLDEGVIELKARTERKASLLEKKAAARAIARTIEEALDRSPGVGD
jgi:prolyl-tRNA synthetase